jgi:hypothetical protein
MSTGGSDSRINRILLMGLGGFGRSYNNRILLSFGQRVEVGWGKYVEFCNRIGVGEVGRGEEGANNSAMQHFSVDVVRMCWYTWLIETRATAARRKETDMNIHYTRKQILAAFKAAHLRRAEEESRLRYLAHCGSLPHGDVKMKSNLTGELLTYSSPAVLAAYCARVDKLYGEWQQARRVALEAATHE